MNIIDLCNDDENISHPTLTPSKETDEGNIAETLFERKANKYQISRNISSEKCVFFASTPPYFPTSENGFASFINLKGFEIEEETFCESSPYSVREKARRQSSIFLVGQRETVSRRSFVCSGIKCCSSSINHCKSRHHGLWNQSQHRERRYDLVHSRNTGSDVRSYASPDSGVIDSASTSRDSISMECSFGLKSSLISDKEVTDYDRELARQVFFFAQNAFPVLCKHVRFSSDLEMLHSLQRQGNKQMRIPNWVFKVGKKLYHPDKDVVGRTSTSKLPDFIGCGDFGKEGVNDPRNCTLVKLPAYLQGANPDLVGELLANARQGRMPTSPPNSSHCPPYSMAVRSKYCQNPIHGQEAPELVHIKCPVEYHYFFHRDNENDRFVSWAIVVGIGVHEHIWPLSRPPPRLVRKYITDVSLTSRNISGPEILEKLRKKFGALPSPATVKSIRYSVRKELIPKGSSISSLLDLFSSKQNGCNRPYVLSVEDYTQEDDMLSTRNQRGISVIFGDERLLRRSLKRPFFGCDGTFGVIKCNKDGNSYELVVVHQR